MQTLSGTEENIRRIAELFPSCVTEVSRNGKTEQAIDFDALRRELQDTLAEDGEERYQFTWPDKRKAKRLAHTKINATLRPCREESVDFDTTHNLYIEGDNLDVLKCLKETYSGQVKMIYIDPPYNTGNDFVYEDDFSESAADYLARSGQYDDQGNRLVTNKESNGRFHTDWLNMIYPRLIVARDLLTEDGVIFISIDDNEVENLRKVCDEVFGECNFVAQVVWERAYSPINLMKHFSTSHDYILVYARNMELAECLGIPRTAEANDRYTNPDNDPRGVWKPSDLSVGPAVESNIYPITTPSGRIVEPPAGRSWSLSAKAFAERLADNRIWFGPNGDGVPCMKRFLSELRKQGMTPMTIWKYTEVGHSQDATKDLAKLFDGKKYFDYPKPVELLKRCLSLYAPQDCLVMDFFSGSGTFAHAVMELNAEDGGKRKYILVQATEKMVNPANVSLKFDTIPQFAEERIRRAGKQIKEKMSVEIDTLARQIETLSKARPSATASLLPITVQQEIFAQSFKEKAQPLKDKLDDLSYRSIRLDIGFRVLKLASSNMLDVFYTPAELRQDDLFSLADNIRPDRTSEDLLFQVMLELGATLDSKIEVLHNADLGLTNCPKQYTVFRVADNYLLACFDTDVTDTVVTAIARLQPQYAVLRDSSLTDDATATNFEQLFRTYAPNTTCRVL